MPGRASSSTTRAAWSSPSGPSRTRTSTAAPTSRGRPTTARASPGRAPSRPTRPASVSRSPGWIRRAGSSPPGSTSATSPGARAAGRAYPGAALAYAWEDGEADFGNTAIALDNTCECCRLGLAFAGAGRPAVVVPQHLPGLGARSRGHHLPGRRRRRDRFVV